MRSLEYGLHCVRKHLAGITAWLVEVEDKLATLYKKIGDEIVKKQEEQKVDKKELEKLADLQRKIIEDIKHLAEIRWTIKALLEDYHKRASQVNELEEAYDMCLTLMGYIREVRVWLDKKVLEWISWGVEPAIYDEVREIISNILAAEHHISDTFESVLKEKEEKEEKAKGS